MEKKNNADYHFYEELLLKEKIKYSQEHYSNKPTKHDYAHLKRVLRDFGVVVKTVNIPDFKTFADMERWQRNYIKTYLNNID